ncbi:hypothetical protein EIP91_012107 [Steccherinum ochraceum]|uniref:Peptidase A1 domain-containing protein n=1 Tax=Steccherinum ochraceum TaxID=92696 RepID=A0A4R0RY65_9APHY|nr:hypothetical protein EIP91_012107 [Steccherinum ochraceum]
MFTRYFTTLLFLALSVASLPVEEPLLIVPLSKHVRSSQSGHIVQDAQMRATALRHAGVLQTRADAPNPAPVPLTDAATIYTAEIGVGSPSTKYNLIVDTGSSNTWIGNGRAYVKTATSNYTGCAVSVAYGSGAFSGKEYTDTVTLGSGMQITGQSIGVASSSRGFNGGHDGILGLGPVELTADTVDGVNLVPTVTDNLSSQKKIKQNLIAVSLQPVNSTVANLPNGEMSFGQTNPAKFTGAIEYFPITRTSPSSMYWGVDHSITYGKQQILTGAAGIVDTGSTLTLIPSGERICNFRFPKVSKLTDLPQDAFELYKKATGGVLDRPTGLLKLTSVQYANLQPLNFVINGKTFALSPNAQIWPRALNQNIGGQAGFIYLTVADIKTPSGDGFDTIMGMSFLERFYSVYDTTNKRVGLASTAWTNLEVN